MEVLRPCNPVHGGPQLHPMACHPLPATRGLFHKDVAHAPVRESPRRPRVCAPPEAKPKKPSKKKDAPDKFHKGWRVVGVKAEAAEEAAREHAAKAREAERKGKPIPAFNLDSWLLKARKKALRSKPYELESAAHECARLAKQAGWLGLEVRAISKGEE